MHRLSFAKRTAAVLALLCLLTSHPVQAQNLFVGANGYVEQYTHDGADLGVFYRDSVGNHLGHTSGLTFDLSGNLYIISDPKYGIVKISPTGTYLGSFGMGTGVAYNSVATDALGNVYAVNSYKHTVDKFSSLGTSLGTFANLSPGEIVYSGIAADKFGNLYVSTSLHASTYGAYTNSITKYSLDGTSLGVFATPNSDYGTQCLTFSHAGNLMLGQFNEYGRSSAFQQFASDGTNLGRFHPLYGVYDPLQLAFDASDNLFVDDNGSVLEYDHAGNVVGHNGNIYLNLGVSASSIAFAQSGPAAVPEAPTTFSLGLLMALGIGGIVFSRRKRSSQ